MPKLGSFWSTQRRSPFGLRSGAEGRSDRPARELHIFKAANRSCGVRRPPGAARRMREALYLRRRRADNTHARLRRTTIRTVSLFALSQLKRDRPPLGSSARKQPERNRTSSCRDGQHGALWPSAAIPCLRRHQSRDVQDFMLKSGLKPGPRLEIPTTPNRDRAFVTRTPSGASSWRSASLKRTEHRLGRIIHRHPGAGRKRQANRDLRHYATVRVRLSENRKDKSGHR